MHLLALLGLLTDRNDRFPYLLIYFNQGNHYSLSYTANLQKVPLSRGASLYKPWWGVPPGVPLSTLSYLVSRTLLFFSVSLFTLRDSFFNRFSVLEYSNRLTPCLYFHVVFYRL